MINISKIILTYAVVLALFSGTAIAIETNGVDVKYVTGDITGLTIGADTNKTITVSGIKVSLGSKMGNEDGPLVTGHIEKLNDDNSNESVTKVDIGLLSKVNPTVYVTGSIGLLSSSIGSSTSSTTDGILGGSFLKLGGGYTFNSISSPGYAPDGLEFSAGYNRYITFGEGMNEIDIGIKYLIYNDVAISVDYTSSSGAATAATGNRVATGLAMQY